MLPEFGVGSPAISLGSRCRVRRSSIAGMLPSRCSRSLGSRMRYVAMRFMWRCSLFERQTGFKRHIKDVLRTHTCSAYPAWGAGRIDEQGYLVEFDRQKVEEQECVQAIEAIFQFYISYIHLARVLSVVPNLCGVEIPKDVQKESNAT